jgi:hypothetical protein
VQHCACCHCAGTASTPLTGTLPATPDAAAAADGEGTFIVDSVAWVAPHAISASALWYDAADGSEGDDAYVLGVTWGSWAGTADAAPQGLVARQTSFVMLPVSLSQRRQAAQHAAPHVARVWCCVQGRPGRAVLRLVVPRRAAALTCAGATALLDCCPTTRMRTRTRGVASQTGPTCVACTCQRGSCWCTATARPWTTTSCWQT